MNRGLLVFALFLILVGVGSGLYIMSLFGVLLFVSAALSSQRKPKNPVPVSQGQEGARVPPMRPMRAPGPQSMERRMPVAAVEPAPVAVPPVQLQMPSSDASQTPNYSPAIFPSAIFPSLSLMGSPAQPSPPQPAKPGQTDELMEMGVLLAVLRLAFG